MITMKVDSAKNLFFDSPKVIAATERGERNALRKFGGTVRKIARNSMKKRKGPSKPGQPPSSHTDLIRQFLFFVWDEHRKGVVIGPAQLNRSDRQALELLERGGKAVRRILVLDKTGAAVRFETKSRVRGARGRFVSANDVRVVTSKNAPPQTVTYPARPFMGPALAKALPALPEFLKDCVKR